MITNEELHVREAFIWAGKKDYLTDKWHILYNEWLDEHRLKTPIKSATVYDGWDCTDSPDGKCHYYTTDKGLVSLNTGEEVAPPPGHESDNESEDWCIFCGEPEERK